MADDVESMMVSDMDIQALLDDELEPDRRHAVLEKISNSPNLRRRLQQYAHQKQLLKLWWKDN